MRGRPPKVQSEDKIVVDGVTKDTRLTELIFEIEKLVAKYRHDLSVKILKSNSQEREVEIHVVVYLR